MALKSKRLRIAKVAVMKAIEEAEASNSVKSRRNLRDADYAERA
jgi:hypothetical protein